MRFIILDLNKKVIATRQGPSMVSNEIESELGEMGQIQQEDGSFVDDTTPLPPQPKSEIEILKEQLATQQGAIDFIVMNF